MEHIIVLFILALCFFHFFIFISCACEITKQENFSDEYKLMVASCVVFVFHTVILVSYMQNGGCYK